MSKSTIEWTEHTANPIIGCSKCSSACDNCYALKRAVRLASMRKGFAGKVGADYRSVVTDGEWNGKTVFILSVLDKIVRRKKPTTYFIGSMTDIFHESVPFEWIHEIWDVMKRTPQHRYMILTKRPERMNEVVGLIYRKEALGHAMGFWSHVALGVSVWNQDSWDRNVGALLRTPAARRFVSGEPLLGPINTSGVDLSKIDLVIVGGETGHGARPMHPDWARSLRDQCASAGVPFMFKQWGACGYDGQGMDQSICPKGHITMFPGLIAKRVVKKAAGRLLDGEEHNGSIRWEVVR